MLLGQPRLLTRGKQGRAKLGEDGHVGPSNTKPSGEPPCLRSAGHCWRPWDGDGCHSCPGTMGSCPPALAAGGGVWVAGLTGAHSSTRTGRRWGGHRPGHRCSMEQDAPCHPPCPDEDAWARILVLAEQVLSLLSLVARKVTRELSSGKNRLFFFVFQSCKRATGHIFCD